jgi:Ankyrin repeats (3 copies)
MRKKHKGENVLHKMIFLVGLSLGISLQGMENQTVVDSRSSSYHEVHNELMDMCRAPLASFDKKRFDLLVGNFRINANHVDSRHILCQEGVTLLGAACAKANCHAVTSLLKKGANPNAETSRYTLPVLAVMASDAEIETQITVLEVLKAHGAHFNDAIDTHNIDTPLHKAASQYPHIVPYLLKQNDMPVNGLGMYGRTPLIYALEGFRNNPHTEEAVRALILHKASIAIKDRFDQSIWHYAAQYDTYCLEHNNRKQMVCAPHEDPVCNPRMVQLLKSRDLENKEAQVAPSNYTWTNSEEFVPYTAQTMIPWNTMMQFERSKKS